MKECVPGQKLSPRPLPMKTKIIPPGQQASLGAQFASASDF